MSVNTNSDLLLAVILVVFLTIHAYFKLKQMTNVKPSTVIVHMPPNANPLEHLVPAEVTREIDSREAVLWYTVYRESLDNNSWVSDAIDAANAAVDNVFHNPKIKS